MHPSFGFIGLGHEGVWRRAEIYPKEVPMLTCGAGELLMSQHRVAPNSISFLSVSRTRGLRVSSRTFAHQPTWVHRRSSYFIR